MNGRISMEEIRGVREEKAEMRPSPLPLPAKAGARERGRRHLPVNHNRGRGNECRRGTFAVESEGLLTEARRHGEVKTTMKRGL